jgi:hypothetical protein
MNNRREIEARLNSELENCRLVDSQIAGKLSFIHSPPEHLLFC